jgi:uncharacterized protein (TIGR00297 family)
MPQTPSAPSVPPSPSRIVVVYSERQRKLLHIAMGSFAALLRYLTWPQAAAMAVTAIAFNAFVLGKLAPQIVRATDRPGVRAGVLFYPLAVLVLVLVFPHRLDIVAAAWGVMAFGDGSATLAGTTIGGPRLPWNPHKTWSGLLAFVIVGSAGAVALSVFVAPAITPAPPWQFTVWAPVAAAIAAGLAETMPIELDDNVSVPAAAGAVLWYLAQLNWMPAADALLFDLLVGCAVSIPVAIAARRVGRITVGGALTGLVLGAVVYAGLFLAGLVVLGVALALALAASRFNRTGKTPEMILADDGGRRGAGNIIANCVVGTLGAALELFSFDWGLELASAWFVAAIAAGASDTVASEIGIAWGGTPRSFPTGRPVPAGTPGAISVVGIVAGVGAAAVIAMPAAAMWLIPWTFVPPIVVACSCGALLESALATRYEQRRVLDNNTLNFLNTAAAAAVAVSWCTRIGTGAI